MRLCLLCLAAVLTGCMKLHHVQIGEIDASGGLLPPIEVEIEVAGLDEQAVVDLISDQAGSLLALASQGPRTGIPRRKSDLGDHVIADLLEACPSGRVTGLSSRRETFRAPFAGAEHMRINGYCIDD